MGFYYATFLDEPSHEISKSSIDRRGSYMQFFVKMLSQVISDSDSCLLLLGIGGHFSCKSLLIAILELTKDSFQEF